MKFYLNPWDFPVEKRPLYGKRKRDTGSLVPDKVGVWRKDTDKFLGIVSEDHPLVTNQQLVERFEEILTQNDTKFHRTVIGTNDDGNKFLARYQFPEINLNVGSRDTIFGAVPEDICMQVDIFNGYGGSKSIWMELYGLVLICLNGLRSMRKAASVRTVHQPGKTVDEILDSVSLDAITMTTLLKDLGDGWLRLTQQEYDASKLAKLVEILNFGKRYDEMFYKFIRTCKMKSMWDTLMAVTAFTSHVVEKRNFQRSREIALISEAFLVDGIIPGQES